MKPGRWTESQRKRPGEITPERKNAKSLLTKQSARAWHGIDFRELNPPDGAFFMTIEQHRRIPISQLVCWNDTGSFLAGTRHMNHSTTRTFYVYRCLISPRPSCLSRLQGYDVL